MRASPIGRLSVCTGSGSVSDTRVKVCVRLWVGTLVHHSGKYPKDEVMVKKNICPMI